MAASPLSLQESPVSPPLLLEGPPSVTIATAAASRRLPPPCWSHEETIALIDAYRDKWYALRRGNLRAVHWQEVADDVASRSPPVASPKTAVQCRHKMEKLRKRYRSEIQRSGSYGGSKSNRYCSAWVHFKRMDAMEKGTSATPAAATEADDEDEEEEDQDDSHLKRIGDIYKNKGNRSSNSFLSGTSFHSSVGNGFRIRIPGIRSVGAGAGSAKVFEKYEDMGGGRNPFPNAYTGLNYGSSKVPREGFTGKAELGKRSGDPVSEMVSAIRLLGDGFVRMERMKMDMAKEVEEMRMEMEMKRTEMILESQQKILEAFAKGISERKTKKLKRDPDTADS